jgi:potassium-transporting ATPase potassium-binding subunit
MGFDIRSLWDVIALIGIVLACAPWFGRYLGRVYMDRPLPGDTVLTPLESMIYRLLGTSPRQSMRAGEYMFALLLVNGGLLGFLFFFLFWQAGLPGNPTGVPNMTWDLAFHSASSFTTNTNFTHFTNESQLSFASLMVAWPVALFLSPATGLAVAAAAVRGFVRRDGTLGNFYVDMVRSLTRVLLPIATVAAVVMVVLGVPQTLTAYVNAHPITGGIQTIYLGPVASYQAASLLGSNGGGFYAANMASPLANPSVLSNLFGTFVMMLIPFSAPFAFGTMVRRRGEAWPYLVTIVIVFAVALGLFIAYQAAADPFASGITGLGPQVGGYPVGQEVRWSLPEGSLFQVASVYGNVGANNMQIGALSPIAQLVLLFGMFTQATPGGVGTGFGMLLLFSILGIFVAGLMVGRTPEYLGKKIGTSQVRWATLALLIHPATILVPFAVSLLGGFVSISAATAVGVSPAHAFTAVLYEFTSESANNGSALSSGAFNDATPFFNLAGAAVMLVGRYLPIFAMLKIGELFARQDAQPPNPGTLKTATATYSLYLTLFLIITTALIFLPVIALGPLAQIVGGG